MRRFLTIGIKGNGKIDVLHGGEEEKRSHIDVYNEIANKKTKKKSKAKYAEVHVIDLSKGVIKKKRFDTVDGSGKRTIARTIKKRKKAAKKSAKKAAKKSAQKSPKAPKNAKKTSSKKAGGSTAPSGDAKAKAEASKSAPAPQLPGAAEVK